MWLLGIVLVLLVIALIIIGQKLARKVSLQDAQQTPSTQPQEADIPVAQHYRSDKVGNDAAARPWDQGADIPAHTPRQQASNNWAPSQPGTLTLRPDQLPDRMPAHFDLALFLERSKEAFMRLHSAWENGDAPALRELLVPAIWQQVEPAIASQALPDWGQRIGDVQHLAARALEAQSCADGALRIRMEFTGSQMLSADAQLRPIHEIWDVRYQEHPQSWQIADLQGWQP